MDISQNQHIAESVFSRECLDMISKWPISSCLLLASSSLLSSLSFISNHLLLNSRCFINRNHFQNINVVCILCPDLIIWTHLLTERKLERKRSRILFVSAWVQIIRSGRRIQITYNIWRYIFKCWPKVQYCFEYKQLDTKW